MKTNYNSLLEQLPHTFLKGLYEIKGPHSSRYRAGPWVAAQPHSRDICHLQTSMDKSNTVSGCKRIYFLITYNPFKCSPA